MQNVITYTLLELGVDLALKPNQTYQEKLVVIEQDKHKYGTISDQMQINLLSGNETLSQRSNRWDIEDIYSKLEKEEVLLGIAYGINNSLLETPDNVAASVRGLIEQIDTASSLEISDHEKAAFMQALEKMFGEDVYFRALVDYSDEIVAEGFTTDVAGELPAKPIEEGRLRDQIISCLIATNRLNSKNPLFSRLVDELATVTLHMSQAPDEFIDDKHWEQITELSDKAGLSPAQLQNIVDYLGIISGH